MTEAYAAIIAAAITAIAGPLITYYFTAVHPTKVFPTIPAKSKSHLDGRWNGTGIQQEGPEGQPLEHTIIVTLKCGKRKISGDAAMHVAVGADKYIMNYMIDGIFFEDRILSFTYRNTDGAVRQFGAAVLELDTSGRRLRGLISGYGFLSKTIVDVRVELEKAA